MSRLELRPDVVVLARLLGQDPHAVMRAFEVTVRESALEEHRHQIDELKAKVARLELPETTPVVASSSPEESDFLGQWCSRHREWTDSPDENRCPVCFEEAHVAAENRARAIRSVVAAQWAAASVAAAFFETHGGSWVVAELAKTLAELPCAADIVDGAAC